MRCEDIESHPDFRRLASVEKVVVDLRYAGVNNFVGRDLYGTLDCAWLHHLAASGLKKAAQFLAHDAPSHRLLVLDAMRRWMQRSSTRRAASWTWAAASTR